MTEIPAAATDSPRIPWEDPAVGAVSGLFRTIGVVISRPGDAFVRVANGSGLGRPFAFGIVIGYVAIVVALLWNALTQAFMMRMLARFAPEMRGQLEQGQAVSDATLTSLVAELRSALGETSRRSRFVRTVHRFGYAFKGAVIEPQTRPTPGDRPRCWVIWDGGQVSLDEGEHLLGRDRDVAVWLESPTVSRHHARIRVADRPRRSG